MRPYEGPSVALREQVDPMFAVQGVRRVLLLSDGATHATCADGDIEPPKGSAVTFRALRQLARMTGNAPQRLVVRGSQGSLTFQFRLPDVIVGVEAGPDADHPRLQLELEGIDATLPSARPSVSVPVEWVEPPAATVAPEPELQSEPAAPEPTTTPPAAPDATSSAAPEPTLSVASLPPTGPRRARSEARAAFARVAVVARTFLGPRVVATYFRAARPAALDAYSVADDASLVVEEGRIGGEELPLLCAWLDAFVRRVMKVVLDFDDRARVAVGESAAWLIANEGNNKP